MKTRNVLIVGGLALLAYYLWRGTGKKPLLTKGMTNKEPLGGGAKVLPAKDVMLPAPVTVNDLSSREAATRRERIKARVRNPRVVLPAERAEVKEEVVVQRTNLLPNAYNDNVGLPVERATIVHTTAAFQNFSGNTATIQDVCRCIDKQPKYRSALPKMP